MEDTLVIFDTAKLAWQKGFNESKDYFQEVYFIEELKKGKNAMLPNFHHSFKIGDLFKPIDYRGFDGDCEVIYKSDQVIIAPTQSLLQKWLREVHNIHIQNHFLNNEYVVKIKYDTNKSKNVFGNDSYEEALEMGLQEALKLIKMIPKKVRKHLNEIKKIAKENGNNIYPKNAERFVELCYVECKTGNELWNKVDKYLALRMWTKEPELIDVMALGDDKFLNLQTLVDNAKETL